MPWKANLRLGFLVKSAKSVAVICCGLTGLSCAPVRRSKLAACRLVVTRLAASASSLGRIDDAGDCRERHR